jgi:GntR family transcriptional regulator, transcriptional repressor for pyruvate dehydrogenase complex
MGIDTGLTEQVVVYLRDLIAKSSLRPGDRLPGEAEMSRTLGVSRPVVREATRLMAAVDLVEVTAGRPPRVGQMKGRVMQRVFENALLTGQAEAIQILEVRRGLEISMAPIAAERRDDATVDQLETLCRAMAGSLRDPYTFLTHDVAFHDAIAAASKNPFYVVLVEGCRASLATSIEVGLLHRFSDAELESVQTVHVEIARAIRERDAAAATDAMTRHFDEALMALYRAAQGGRQQSNQMQHQLGK